MTSKNIWKIILFNSFMHKGFLFRSGQLLDDFFIGSGIFSQIGVFADFLCANIINLSTEEKMYRDGRDCDGRGRGGARSALFGASALFFESNSISNHSPFLTFLLWAFFSQLEYSKMEYKSIRREGISRLTVVPITLLWIPLLNQTLVSLHFV